jgi:DNA-binding CsgD family transcriptional regulator
MQVHEGGCEVVLVREGCVITRFHLDLPAGMLVEQVDAGKRHFNRFGLGQKLNTVCFGDRVFVWVGSKQPDLDSLAFSKKRNQADCVSRKSTGLTDRQRQVLDGLICGWTLAEIGYRLGIRTRSVRHHVDALKLKLGAVSLSELVARAVTSGFPISSPPQVGSGAEQQRDHPKVR